MSPMEALVAGGAAEAFERHLRQLYRGGYRRLVVDLSGMAAMDSAGMALAHDPDCRRRPRHRVPVHAAADARSDVGAEIAHDVRRNTCGRPDVPGRPRRERLRAQ